MPNLEKDAVSENGRNMFKLYQTPEKLTGPQFSYGEVKKPNFGQEIPDSALASDQASFTGPIEPTFTKNANKHSEGGNNNYNKGHQIF